MAARKTSAARKPAAARSVQLAEVLDLNALGSLAGELNAARGHDLVIDASRTVRIGAQAFQLLVSARRSWDADGRELRVQGAFEPFRDQFELLGLDENDLLGSGHKMSGDN